jgi:NTF2 fold immunity protein of polymorphic toxin system component
MKLRIFFLSALFLVSSLLCQARKSKPRVVADSATAIEIAEAALIPVYGRKQIESERPFNATLSKGVWTVTGTLHCSDGKGGTTTVCVGGVAGVEISKDHGRILRMWHTK